MWCLEIAHRLGVHSFLHWGLQIHSDWFSKLACKYTTCRDMYVVVACKCVSVPPIPHLANTFNTDVRQSINSQYWYLVLTMHISPAWLLAKRLCKLLLFTRFPPLLMLSWQWRQVALVMSTVLITKCSRHHSSFFLPSYCTQTRAFN